METISNLLFWISNGLLVPVVLVLLLLFVRAILMAMSFFGELYQRMKLQAQLAQLLEEITPSEAETKLRTLPLETRSRLMKAIDLLLEHRAQTDYRERLLANYEVDAERELAQCRTLVKLGPMMGLMGTLIPMGPALVGLASGDITSMAYNMQVAFATTVVGVFVAAIGVVTLQVKQRWYAREQNDLEYISKTLAL